MKNKEHHIASFITAGLVIFLASPFIRIPLVRTVRAQTISADANNDGLIDGIDYLVWLVNYSKTATDGPQSGDFNRDNQVDGTDYVAWLGSYGTHIPTGTTVSTPTQVQPTGNIALNRPVAASSHDTDAPNPSAVVDGNTTTRWSSAWSQPQWIQIDLGQRFTISHVILRWQRSYGSGYHIEVSDDALTWTRIFSTTTGNGATDDLTGLNGQGRYIRMYGTQRACDGCGSLYGFSLYEFEIYAVGGGITSTPTVTSIPRTNTPTQATINTPTSGAGCYVKVAGFVYNMQSSVGKKLIDPNTNKSQTHSTGDFKCGSISNPTDVTSTYLSKHLKLGCSPRLAPYILTPPAPPDPTCE